jgi:hypothetical protein
MAIINSYPLVIPKLTDLILGTSAGSNGRNKTASFTVGAMQSLMAGVTSVTSGNVNTIVIGGTTQQPTVGSVTAAIVQNGLSLATGGDIYTFVTTNHPGTVSGTGTFNTLTKWSVNGADIEDSALLDDTSGQTLTITSRQVWPATTDSKDLGGTANRWKNLWASQTLYAENIVLGSFTNPPTAVNTYISLQGSTGTAGQVLTSGGNGLSATWTDNVSGTGTINTVPIFTSARAIGDSLISQASNGIIIDGVGTDGKLTLNCSAGTHGVTLQSPSHASSATYTLILPTTSGVAGQVLSSGGGSPSQLVWSTQSASGVLSVVTGDANTITVAGTAADPTVAANTTAGVGTGLPNLATGGQIQAAIDTAVSSSLTYRGGYNASTNTPDLTTSPNSILTGDTYAVTAAGDASGFWSPTLNIGDLVIANIDSPATIADWTEVQSNIDVATDTVQGIANFPTSGGLSVTGGAVSIADTTVAAGTYTNTNLTVDAQGRITTAASGSAGGYVDWTAKADNAGTTVSIVNQENVTFGGGDGLTTDIATDGSGNTTITTTAAGFAGVAIAGNAGYVPDSTAATAGTFLQADGTWAAAGGLPTITVNTGAGNAATTVYPLSVTPSSVNYVNVFINGVYQAKSSYSVSGTNLTFAAAPPNNSVIEFVTTT